MGLTGFNRQRKRALMEIVEDEALADKLMAYGFNEPERLAQASEDDLHFLSEAELAKCGKDSSKLSELKVAEIKKMVGAVETVRELEAMLEKEKAGKDRKGAKEAIQARIEALQAEPEEPKDEEEAEEPEGEQTESDEETEAETGEPEEEAAEAESEEKEKKDTKANNDFESLPEDTEFPYNYGGNWYFLSDGSKVQGAKAAENAQKALDDGG